MSETAAPRVGVAVIQAYVQDLPNAPGVYRMFDSEGELLYVGKAANLKKRVASYTKLAGHTMRIARMIAGTAAMEFVTTASAVEALLLESNLIKRLKPRYNVQLRDDKSFPFIHVTGDHAAPQIRKHRGAQDRPGRYFGPFASAGAVNRTLNTLQRAFLLRSCSDSVYENRTRPCLLFQIKRCAAPCVGKIGLEEYGALAAEATRFLTGKSGDVRTALVGQMEAASADLDFERAARLRDRIRALAHVQLHQGINPETVEDADLFAVAFDQGQFCVQVFFFRSGQNWGNRAYFPKADRTDTSEDVLEAFLGQFYDEREAPKLVLLDRDIADRDLLAEALTVRAGRKVEVLVPQRGEKRDLAGHAQANAREALARRLAETAQQENMLEAVADVFALSATPRRIEIYDNSHIQGAHAIGAFVVAGPQGFEKGQYRKFNIKSADLPPGDDFGMMREVLTRRFERLLQEERKAQDQAAEAPVFEDGGTEDGDDGDAPQGKWASAPDLVLIDGGAGQLSAAHHVLDALGLAQRVALVSIAKGPQRNAGLERFFQIGRDPVSPDPRSPVMFFLQRLRDEAHRFAIGTHRAKRAVALTSSPLDEIEGIGARRKRALLNHFGSARAVAQAGITDLMGVEGISEAMAKRIYAHYHDKV
jgi:excinuclease ABC subunit C